MKDRKMVKWRPFNSVVPSSELLKKEECIERPNLSKDEITEYEEKLKFSLYNSSIITIVYFNKNKISEITDQVIKIDSLTQNIYFKDGTIINFRQIYKVK